MKLGVKAICNTLVNLQVLKLKSNRLVNPHFSFSRLTYLSVEHNNQKKPIFDTPLLRILCLNDCPLLAEPNIHLKYLERIYLDSEHSIYKRLSIHSGRLIKLELR